jgi:hypothetical protein
MDHNGVVGPSWSKVGSKMTILNYSVSAHNKFSVIEQ